MHQRDDIYRIYFGARNEHNHTQPGFLEIDVTSPGKILRISEVPVLETGPTGRFDDSGIWPSWIVEREGEQFLYYNGWTTGGTVPYISTTGVAVSDDGGESFQRPFDGPIIGRSPVDPYINGGPCVHLEDGRWRMWYLSANDFQEEEEGPMYYYEIKYAESSDGLDWEPKDLVCIPLQHEGETRIARPCVRKRDDGYEMWYSFAIGHEGYRIGYATSPDGYEWERRDDEVTFESPMEQWESGMRAYPYVFAHGDTQFMLYNGNDYGRGGFGLGELAYD